MHINVKEKLIDASKNEVIRAQGEMNNEVFYINIISPLIFFIIIYIIVKVDKL